MTNIKNMADLIKDLSVAYEELRSKSLVLTEAKEIANMAGKLIKACAVQLKYNEYMKNGEEIPFLQTTVAEENKAAA